MGKEIDGGVVDSMVSRHGWFWGVWAKMVESEFDARGQTTEEGFIQFVEDDRTIMAGDKSFADITKSVNYGFKNPGDFADAHKRSETGPVPIGGTKPANGLNG